MLHMQRVIVRARGDGHLDERSCQRATSQVIGR